MKTEWNKLNDSWEIFWNNIPSVWKNKVSNGIPKPIKLNLKKICKVFASFLSCYWSTAVQFTLLSVFLWYTHYFLIMDCRLGTLGLGDRFVSMIQSVTYSQYNKNYWFGQFSLIPHSLPTFLRPWLLATWRVHSNSSFPESQYSMNYNILPLSLHPLIQ